MSARDNLLAQLEGWADAKMLTRGYNHSGSCEDCHYEWGREGAFEELLEYIAALKGEK